MARAAVAAFLRMSSRVTVLIPCYNAAPYLAEALDSVFAQTRQPDEVILIDDASTDGSLEVAERYQIRILRNETNVGSAVSRNKGIAHATGDLVAMLDADDIWFPDHLETMVGLLHRHPEAALAGSDSREHGGGSAVVRCRIPEGGPQYCFWEAFDTWLVPHSSAVIRASALREVGGYRAPANAGEDFDLWLRLSWRYPAVSVSRVTVLWRVHARQLSHGAYWAHRLEAVRRRAQFIADVRATAPSDVLARMRRRSAYWWLHGLVRVRRDGAMVRAFLRTPPGGVPTLGVAAEVFRDLLRARRGE